LTTRNLDALFAPKSITLVGATNRPGSVGAVLVRNLVGAGFNGDLSAVNPHGDAIASFATFKSVDLLPEPVDLAIIATPAATVPAIIQVLAKKGCKAAVVISAGLSGAPLRQQMLDAAKPSLLRIIGPNCLGFISPHLGINASFAQLTPKAGGLALVAQSGAVTTAALDWASDRGFGFSRVVTLGDMIDVDFGDVLDYLALDQETSAILLYVESITHARKFMSAARAAARIKPVVVIKAGRSAAGAKAAYSHTGALAGSDLVYDAVFRRAGMLRVGELREMFDAVSTLTAGLKVAGDRLLILTNGGGAGVMATDALAAGGGRLAILDPETIAALDGRLPNTWSRGNPIDIIGDAPPSRYAQALEVIGGASSADAILVLNCPTALSAGVDAARAVIDTVAALPASKPLLTCWLGDTAAREGRQAFSANGIPGYETPEEAVRAFMHLADHHRNQALLSETPPASGLAPDRKAVESIFAKVIADRRNALTEFETKAVLRAYGIPTLESHIALDPADAAKIAESLQGPFALKIRSPQVTHKSDVGGVALGLLTPAAVEAAAQVMLAQVATAVPGARLEGFTLQQMVVRPHAHELIAGIAADGVFGPVILLGAGGVEVEVLADRTMGLPPLNRPLANDMIRRTRVAKQLTAFRDHPAADLEAVADVLVRLSWLSLDFPMVAELDINPLIADEAGVVALDARMRIGSALAEPAIRPYPANLEHQVILAGEPLTIRAILPEDENGLIDLVRLSSHEDVRFRFRGSVRELPHAWAARLSQIDYDREMALVALAGASVLGVARLAADPEGEAAEFALLVRSDHHRRGIGTLLMTDLLAYARSRNLKRMWGDVMWSNTTMIKLMKGLGFHHEPGDSAELVRVTIQLGS
jgi:acetyltransferase